MLHLSGGASALESELESVLLERDHRVAGFSQSVPVYLSQAYLCTPDARFVPKMIIFVLKQKLY